MKNTQPQNLEAEEAVIASCLISKEYLSQALEILTYSDFYKNIHGNIFKTFQDLNNKNKPVDLVTVVGHMQGVDGIASIMSKISDTSPLAVNIKAYAETVKDASTKRKIIDISQKMIQGAQNGDSAVELLNRSQEQILNIEHSGYTDNVKQISELVGDRYVHWESIANNPGVTGVPTGLDIDSITGGFHNTDLVIIAARPSMGKTALAMTMAGNMADRGLSVGFFSLEMSEEQLMDRWASMESRVDGYRFRTGYFKKDDWGPINEAASRFYNWRIFIDDTPGLSYMQVRRIGRKMKKLNNIDVLFVDYLQLMSGDHKEGRVREVGSISRNMKHMAKELGIPVIVLSQLSRKVEGRSNRRPVLSDLRDSGEVEQDADVVMFIYRDEVYNKQTSKCGIAEINVAKHRNGPTGVRSLAWLKSLTRFENLDTQQTGTKGA